MDLCRKKVLKIFKIWILLKRIKCNWYPWKPNFDEFNENVEMSIKLPKEKESRIEKMSQMNTNMTMSKIPNIFGNSTFNNCTINFQMPQ